MPQIFKIGSFGGYINPRVLQNILRIIEARNDDVVTKWIAHFGEISYFC